MTFLLLLLVLAFYFFQKGSILLIVSPVFDMNQYTNKYVICIWKDMLQKKLK